MPPVSDTVQILVIDHEKGAQRGHLRLDRFPVRLGRGPANDVHLDFPFISTWHAEIRRGTGGELLIVDLGARNGLMVAGKRLPQGASIPLRGELSVTVGTLELRIQAVAGGALAGPPPPADDDQLPDLAGLHEAATAVPRRTAAVVGGELDDQLPVLPEDSRGPEISARIARVQASVQRLRPLHEQLERSRRAWEDTLLATVRELRAAASDPESREHDERMLLRTFPRRDLVGLGGERSGADLPEISALAQAASELLPGMRTPSDDHEARRFLARLVDVLRVFAASTLELQHVRRSQAAELGSRWQEPSDPLAAVETPEDVLRYLLDWRDSGERRSEELVRAFAALADHLHCYVSASLVAARALVDALSPAEIERGASDRWPTRAAALWRHYQACFASLRGDTYDHLTPAFRAALGQAYSDALARAGVPTRRGPHP
jgi:predicted component of type VI protein secretion system